MPFGFIGDPVGAVVNNLDRGSRITDYLTNYRFHVLDVSFSVPTVFTPAFGFSYVTGPGIQSTVKEFKEGTFEYPVKVISGAVVDDISFHRGNRFFDSDFYDWISAAIRGDSDRRKNLLLIQYSDIAIGGGPGGAAVSFTLGVGQDPVQRVPARAWFLVDCIPTIYKSSNDFDASGGDISIQELTVAPRFVQEFNLGI